MKIAFYISCILAVISFIYVNKKINKGEVENSTPLIVMWILIINVWVFYGLSFY